MYSDTSSHTVRLSPYFIPTRLPSSQISLNTAISLCLSLFISLSVSLSLPSSLLSFLFLLFPPSDYSSNTLPSSPIFRLSLPPIHALSFSLGLYLVSSIRFFFHSFLFISFFQFSLLLLSPNSYNLASLPRPPSLHTSFQCCKSCPVGCLPYDINCLHLAIMISSFQKPSKRLSFSLLNGYFMTVDWHL